MNESQKTALLQLLKDFYEISGQRTAIFDKYYNVVLEYPDHYSFCAEIRKSEEGARRCAECDLHGLESAGKSANYAVYRCHANLIEVCAPIRDDFGIIGYLMFGQLIFNQNVEEQISKIIENCCDLIPDRDKLVELCAGLRRMRPEYVNASSNLLLTCASYIQLKQLLISSQNPLWIQIQDYIDRHMSEPFTLSKMSAELHTCVSVICSTTKLFSPKTVMQLATEKRVQAAKKLLLKGELPISKVAESVGIADYNYFSRVFKKHTGVSPRRYREEKTSIKPANNT